jgi:NAD-dependent dihydropyrimidine dehydrogenase PreA subunit
MHLNVNSSYISSLINAKNAIVTLIRVFLYECSLYKILISINKSCIWNTVDSNLQSSEETQNCHILMATSFYQFLALSSAYICKSSIFTVKIKFFWRHLCVCICLICVPACRHYFAKFSNNAELSLLVEHTEIATIWFNKKILCRETNLSAQIGFDMYFINEKYLSCCLSRVPVFYFLFWNNWDCKFSWLKVIPLLN